MRGFKIAKTSCFFWLGRYTPSHDNAFTVQDYMQRVLDLMEIMDFNYAEITHNMYELRYTRMRSFNTLIAICSCRVASPSRIIAVQHLYFSQIITWKYTVIFTCKVGLHS